MKFALKMADWLAAADEAGQRDRKIDDNDFPVRTIREAQESWQEGERLLHKMRLWSSDTPMPQRKREWEQAYIEARLGRNIVPLLKLLKFYGYKFENKE